VKGDFVVFFSLGRLSERSERKMLVAQFASNFPLPLSQMALQMGFIGFPTFTG
jgi:hypothetical protein